MRKIVILVIVVFLATVFSACGGDGNDNSSNTNTSSSGGADLSSGSEDTLPGEAVDAIQELLGEEARRDNRSIPQWQVVSAQRVWCGRISGHNRKRV
jgi:hypothetical protein